MEHGHVTRLGAHDMQNAAVAEVFNTMADIMEIKGENAFRVNTYRKVARIVGELTEDIAQVSEQGRLTDLPGIGQSSAEKIRQFLAKGSMDAYEKLTRDFPMSALDLLRIPNVGPKTVGRWMKEKGICSITDLERALDAGALDGMAGMGAKTLENVRAGLAFLKRSAGRILLGDALPVAQQIIEDLKSSCKLKAVEAAGSLRRRKETIGDIDILATVSRPKSRRKSDGEMPGGREVVQAFTSLEGVEDVLAAGDTKGSVRTTEGLQVDLRVVPPECYGAALVYFTGSKEHNVKIRGLANDRGLKINEYGVFQGEKRIAGKTEQEVYGCLDLPWIPPEMREDRGEIEAAAAGELPTPVERKDIRGDLHVHTSFSDGVLPVYEMARAVRDMGYSYMAITDHSGSLGIAGGLLPERLADQHAEIEAARKKLRGFRILKGTEVDILPDGSLDYPDEVLAGLDIVIASVHSRFGMPEQEMTARICRAAENPYVTAIGHPTGRLIGRRQAYAVDMGAVIAACAACGTALELNANSYRLDATDLVCRQAAQAGVKVLIGTDSHSPVHLWMMEIGVATARRGWLTKADVLNCMSADGLVDYARSKRP